MRIRFIGGRPSAAEAVDYILDPNDKNGKKVTLLGGRGIDLSVPMTEDKRQCAKNLIQSFDLQSSMRPGISKPLSHLCISWLTEERITDTVMRLVAYQFLERLGLNDAQCLIVRHSEKEHQHCHILLNHIAANSGYLHFPHPLWFIFRHISLDFNLFYKFKRGKYRGIAKTLMSSNNTLDNIIAKDIIANAVLEALNEVSQFDDLPETVGKYSNGMVKAEIITKINKKTGLPEKRMKYTCNLPNGKIYKFNDKKAGMRIGYEQLVNAFLYHESIEELMDESKATLKQFEKEKIIYHYYEKKYLNIEKDLRRELSAAIEDQSITNEHYSQTKERLMYLWLIHGEDIQYLNEKLKQVMNSEALERERKKRQYKKNTPKTYHNPKKPH